MKSLKSIFIITFLAACSAISASAQSNPQQIYSSRLERGYMPALYASTPYYPEEFVTGEVTYRGFTYTNLELRLDVDLGTVIIKTPYGRSVYYEASDLEKVVIDGIEVAYLDKSNHRPAKGWYEVIHATPHWTLYRVHSISSKNNVIDDQISKTQFSLSHKLYLAKGDRWIGIKKVGDLAKAFPRQKEEIKEFAKSRNLNPDINATKQWQTIAEHIK